MISKLLGIIVFFDGLANLLYFHFEGTKTKREKLFQLGRAIRAIIGIMLMLL